MDYNVPGQDTRCIENPALEEACPRCAGRGVTSGSICKNCDGSGMAPTVFGEQVLSLVRRNLLGLICEDAP
jgi:hypothetical protein